MMDIKSFLNFLFPPICLHCGKCGRNSDARDNSPGRNVTIGALCKSCLETIPLHATLFCGKCRARLPLGKKICHRDFPYVLGAATSYEGEILRDLVHGLKFRYVKDAAVSLNQLLVRYAEIALPPLLRERSIVLPIPLSKERERARGFNQSRIIAELFAKHFGIPLCDVALERVRDTRAQSELESYEKRRENVEGCFAVLRPELIHGKSIILIDDVTTSGTTFYEAARTLKSARAKEIIALAVARA